MWQYLAHRPSLALSALCELRNAGGISASPHVSNTRGLRLTHRTQVDEERDE